MIKWFRNIENKPNCSFIIFDIQNFYPSILFCCQLFNRAIEFGKEIYNLSNDDISIIMQSRTTLLYSDDEPWVKKDDEDDFDIPLGCYDGAEMCKLVGTYLLNQLKVVIAKENMGLYRDDGLGIFKNMSGPEVERKKKEIVKIFKNNGLSITVKITLKPADFLVIHFDLVKEIYQPYKKANDDPLHINKKIQSSTINTAATSQINLKNKFRSFIKGICL